MSVHALIRADQNRQHSRKLLRDGGVSPVAAVADETYFTGLRDRIRQAEAE